MKVEFDIASDQIDGARDYQEDAYMVNQLGEADNGDLCSLIIMADGMGGHAAGNVASNMVVALALRSVSRPMSLLHRPRCSISVKSMPCRRHSVAHPDQQSAA